MGIIAPARGELDPQYTPKLEQLKDTLKINGFTDEELQMLFADSRVELYPPVVDKSGKGLDYFHPRFGLLSKKSLESGRIFLKRNEEIFHNVEEEFGVEKEIILAILRIETNFGAHTGKYSVFNSLLSMILIENRRTEWATKEFVELLSFHKKQNEDPLALKGSWAGAFGICQFVPTSYLKFAVDGDKDGSINLFNAHDPVASIANYLRHHGYQKEEPEKGREAIYAYNHCDNYVAAVLAYARALQ